MRTYACMHVKFTTLLSFIRTQICINSLTDFNSFFSVNKKLFNFDKPRIDKVIYKMFTSNRYSKKKQLQKANESLKEKERKRANRRSGPTDLFDENVEDELNKLDQACQSSIANLGQYSSTSLPAVSSTLEQNPSTSRQQAIPLDIQMEGIDTFNKLIH